jgi:hypothetical protein
MKQETLEDFELIINIISLFKVRSSQLRKELDFCYKHENIESIKNIYGKKSLIESLNRLKHEIMFLCVDTYSLYKGIRKKNPSFRTKIFNNNGQDIIKVDKGDNVETTILDDNNKEILKVGKGDKKQVIIDLGVLEDTDNQGEPIIRKSTEEELKSSVRQAQKMYSEDSENLQKEVGLKSKKHEDIEDWFKKIEEEYKSDFDKLAEYRDKFAHRFDDFAKIKQEFENELKFDPRKFSEILDTIDRVLKVYDEKFNDIIGYTTTVQFGPLKYGRYGYQSLSKIFYILDNKQQKKQTNQPRTPNLHPDTIWMSDDFDDSLPDAF